MLEFNTIASGFASNPRYVRRSVQAVEERPRSGERGDPISTSETKLSLTGNDPDW